jgi:predicted dinucleotide-binding enzyme
MVVLAVPYAAVDENAKALVVGVGTQPGFDAVDSGPLSNLRCLEPSVELLIQLASGQGLGAGFGLHLAGV